MLTKIRQVRLNPAHDEALKRIATRRGCSVSDVLREAVIEHIAVPADDTQSSTMLASEYTGEASNGE